MEKTTSMQPRSGQTVRTLKGVLIGLFIIAALLTAYLTFVAVRDFVTSWTLTSLPGVSLREAEQNPPASEGNPEVPGVITEPDVPLQPETGPTPVPWDGATRVNVLFMGLDYRDWAQGEGPPRTDTMILFTIDPIARTAGMLSIPRDLWVNIPGGYEYGRINTAYQLGEATKYPGGGPALAMATVEELLGVEVPYYAQVDFGTFVDFVDLIGGVKIDVPAKIQVDPMGDDNTRRLKPGVQTLPGELALAYARARNTEGVDFDRAQRQQQVILGLRNQVLRPDIFPMLMTKAGVIYNELSTGIHTNLNIDQLVRLGWLGSQIPEENIKKGIISPPDQVLLAVSPDGEQQVLKPITEKIRLLRDDIFTGPISPAAASMDPVELMKAENARVAVLNGTYNPGLASTTTEYLKSLGVNVTVADNAQKTVSATEITFYTGKPYTVKYLYDLMKISEFSVHHQYDPASPVDVQVVLGDDWANALPELSAASP